MIVMDASAVLASILGEPGAELVDRQLRQAAVTTVNLAEILSRMAARGDSPRAVHEDLEEAGVLFVNVDVELATVAAELFAATRPAGMSVGDRTCIALAMRLDCPAMTADRRWQAASLTVPIMYIR